MLSFPAFNPWRKLQLKAVCIVAVSTQIRKLFNESRGINGERFTIKREKTDVCPPSLDGIFMYLTLRFID